DSERQVAEKCQDCVKIAILLELLLEVGSAPFAKSLMHTRTWEWSQLSDSAFLDRVNSAKIPLFYGLVKHFSRTPPNPSSTPNLLAILLAIGYCERNCNSGIWFIPDEVASLAAAAAELAS